MNNVLTFNRVDPDAEYTKVPQWKTVFTLFVLFITTVISMNLPIEVSLKFVYLTHPVKQSYQFYAHFIQ